VAPTSTEAKPKSLVLKLAEVMGEVERVAKRGRNEFHKYDYATEADIVQAVRGGLSARGIMLTPNIESVEFAAVKTSGGKDERLCTVSVMFVFEDGHTGETHQFKMIGQGQDGGDKGFYKALTGATKYAVLKQFLISTGDDPEHEKAPSTLPAPSGTAALRQSVAPPAASPQPPRGPSEPPPHTDADLFGAPVSDSQEAPERRHEDIVMGKFGSGAGKRLSELDDNSVSFYRGACKKALADPSKEKWHKSETLRLVAFDAELRFRGLPV